MSYSQSVLISTEEIEA